MAKFSFYDVRIMRFPQLDDKGKEIKDAEPTTLDQVQIAVTKKVCNSTMNGEKSEFYTVPTVDLPFIFLKPEVKFPAIAGNDCTARITAVRKFLDVVLGKSCIVEDVPSANGKKRVLASIEFD